MMVVACIPFCLEPPSPRTLHSLVRARQKGKKRREKTKNGGGGEKSKHRPCREQVGKEGRRSRKDPSSLLQRIYLICIWNFGTGSMPYP